MKSTAARQALDHFVATAAIGLAVAGLGELLPVLTSQQQTAVAGSIEYAVLSLLTAAGMAVYGYLKGHREELTTQLADALDEAQAAQGQDSQS